MLEQHAEDCGFALLVILLVALRAIDYDAWQDQPCLFAIRFQGPIKQGLCSRRESDASDVGVSKCEEKLGVICRALHCVRMMAQKGREAPTFT